MITAKEGNAFAVINAAYSEYYRLTGLKPTRIYVGQCELVDLRRSSSAYVTYKLGEQHAQPMKVMGMQVFEVCEQSHFYVC
jgi:hypothetical protein